MKSNDLYRDCKCSPIAIKNKYHFSGAALRKITEIWNLISENKLATSGSDAVLYRQLNLVMKPYTKGAGKYWLWCGIIERLAEAYYPKNDVKVLDIKKELRKICKKELKPEKPESWYKNPKTWLSNWDIQNVMSQYAMDPKYSYAFLGVFPVDFAVISEGKCVYSNLCRANIKSMLKKGIKFVGLITNLDRHNEPGSHWTSIFMVIDPNLPTYGAYYYDSTGGQIPEYIFMFVKRVKDDCNVLHPKKQFRVFQNKKQHQWKNTECGMFSMLFQVRWLNKHLVKNNNTSFEEIISANPYIVDDQMVRLRDVFFRPNTKMELNKIGFVAKK